MFESWDGPEVAIFWIAIAALVLSVLSLGWQIWTWRHMGSVVHVTANQSLPVYRGEVGAPHVQVAATNKGRGPTTVTSWGLRMPDGNDMTVLYQLPWSSPLPFAILPDGAAGAWFVEIDKVQDACQRAGLDHRHLQAWVRLSDGRQIFAKQSGIGIE
jgi:hypothetical protein